ncbi:Murein DD-endopeptidase MepH precursor [compost metagenome]
MIPESEAKPGDLVVFDDEEHIGIYLGNGTLIHAPDVGRDVSITTVWQGVAHHFTRILPG